MAKFTETLPDLALPHGATLVADLALLKIARTGRSGDACPDLPGIDPTGPTGTVRRSASLTLVTLAPGEWLLTGPEPAVEAAADTLESSVFLAALVQHGRTALRLEPALAAAALTAYSPIDQNVLRSDHAVRTLFGDAAVLLLHETEGHILLVAEAALASYLAALLNRLIPETR